MSFKKLLSMTRGVCGFLKGQNSVTSFMNGAYYIGELLSCYKGQFINDIMLSLNSMTRRKVIPITGQNSMIVKDLILKKKNEHKI